MNHPLFSPKLLVLLGSALEDMLGVRSEDKIAMLIKAYGLPRNPLEGDWRRRDLHEYVEYLAELDEENRGDTYHVCDLLEAIVAELASKNPVVLKSRNLYIRDQLGESTRGTSIPPSFESVLVQLRAEGYAFRKGKISLIDSESPAENQDKSDLAVMVRQHAELDPDTLIHHLEESDETFGHGNWHASTSEARCFLEGLIVNLAKAESSRLMQAISNLPLPGEKRSQFGPCREHLKKVGFTTEPEDQLIREFYSVASVTGSHPGITEEGMAKFVRRYCWITARYLVEKYAAWKANDYKW